MIFMYCITKIDNQLTPYSVQDQSSEPVLLKGGHTYFIEAVSIHDETDAPMKVGVRIPSGKILAPIPNDMLRLERGGRCLCENLGIMKHVKEPNLKQKFRVFDNRKA